MDGENKNCLLIVDDDRLSVQILTHILGPDYEIYTATDGLSAVEKAKEYKPDLILLDIIMPIMDGYETLLELKNSEETCKIPVILITSLDDCENEVKGLSLEAADYITKPFSDKIVKLRVKNQIQIINQLRTIEHLSMIDQLTNLPNRRSFDNRLRIEWQHAIREKTPISILIMDLDKFKYLNDTYGHQCGDFVLQEVAKIFFNSLRRSGDFTARWGGEEFVVLLPNTPLSGAVDFAEMIRSSVENSSIKYLDDYILNITISIGINSLIPDQCNSIDDFISLADKGLYLAKQAGRNRVFSLKQGD
ncbi:MAG: diguanylate cyclase [Treponema sp.]|jgi:diguanylate cyclase (GGDEF)-like protein|nr:diguanylate cyclase [Treponema sp.]